jgi:hypothetical protein
MTQRSPLPPSHHIVLNFCRSVGRDAARLQSGFIRARLKTPIPNSARCQQTRSSAKQFCAYFHLPFQSVAIIVATVTAQSP